MSSGRTGYLVSAPWRSSGKTLLTIGLARAARRRQLAIQTFKKGPDYIDPLWLAAASGTGCYNLDPYIQSESELLSTFYDHTNGQSVALVEGTMGLHDGLQSDGSDSNAAIAVALNLPVILIVDCRGMHRTVAALINGIQQFDPKVRFAGVVLNRIRSSRHELKIRTAMETFCELTLLGIVPETTAVHIGEQELGLTPAPDFELAGQCIDRVADLMNDNCDLDSLFDGCTALEECDSQPAVLYTGSGSDRAIASVTDRLPVDATNCDAKPARFIRPDSGQPATSGALQETRIGLARDAAFHFYYQDDLDRLQHQGATLIELSPLTDEFPTDLDGFIIGGGFPERHASALSGNQGFRESLRRHIKQGLVVHAECAGLMYLCRSLLLDDGQFDMVGCIAGDARMRRKPLGRGYVQLQRCGEDKVVSAHEFHHSEIVFDDEPEFIYRVVRGYGVNGTGDGIWCGNVHASYAHFRHTGATPWVDRFLRRVANAKLPQSVSQPAG